MDKHERYRLLSTGRGGEFRNIVRDMTNHPDDLPTRSELKARLAEVYPGEANVKLRETLFAKLVELAEARAAGMDAFELRGIGDELVVKVETRLADEERILPVQDDEQDTSAAVLAADKYADRIGGDLDRKHDKERAEAAGLVHKAGL